LVLLPHVCKFERRNERGRHILVEHRVGSDLRRDLGGWLRNRLGNRLCRLYLDRLGNLLGDPHGSRFLDPFWN
jgi:hypothetical protein